MLLYFTDKNQTGINMLLQSSIDPVPVIVEKGAGGSPFLLVCEHAGLSVPQVLGDMGLADDSWKQHIASDLGAKQVARYLARQLGPPLVFQQYSRLVIDCNRTYTADSLIPEVSHGTEIPGNRGLDEQDRMARINEIHRPFHTEISQALDRRRVENIPTILVSIHSFTPKLGNEERPWHVGIQYAKNTEFAHIVLNIIREDQALCIGDNLPWPVNETDDYTIPVQGDGRNIPCVMIEVRQDLITTEETQLCWADRLSDTLNRAAREYYSQGLDAKLI